MAASAHDAEVIEPILMNARLDGNLCENLLQGLRLTSTRRLFGRPPPLSNIKLPNGQKTLEIKPQNSLFRAQCCSSSRPASVAVFKSLPSCFPAHSRPPPPFQSRPKSPPRHGVSALTKPECNRLVHINGGRHHHDAAQSTNL